MSDALSAISQMMSQDLNRLRDISQNVTNVNTPGYRAVTDMSGNNTRISMRAGPLKQTGRALDLAISGEGFFAVSTPEGVRYTRDGQFQLKANGDLVTATGNQVLGVNGPITLPSDSVTIDATGQIQYGGEVIGKLQIVSLEHPEKVQPSGNSLYSYGADASSANSFSVHQGTLEQSNVDVTQEFVSMIGLTRHLQGVQHGIMAYDQMLNIGINQIGKR